jgi:hypothetical protein
MDYAPPTPDEIREAIATLRQELRPASIGALGGFRPPDKNERHGSWWGGNFLAMPGEAIPRCNVTHREMHPILQIRVAELPVVPERLRDVALLQLWLDLESKLWFQAANGSGFSVRTYDDTDAMVPLGCGYREHPTFPTFPMGWTLREADAPDWSDFADRIAPSVAADGDADWFFEEAEQSDQDGAPVKVGGWPAWIQGSCWPAESDFIFQVNSTARGNLGFGDGGSIYVFARGGEWLIRGDTF